MFLYSAEGLTRSGISAEQMETKIADELPSLNEAVANSDVDNLQFNLVHTAEVSSSVQRAEMKSIACARNQMPGQQRSTCG